MCREGRPSSSADFGPSVVVLVLPDRACRTHRTQTYFWKQMNTSWASLVMDLSSQSNISLTQTSWAIIRISYQSPNSGEVPMGSNAGANIFSIRLKGSSDEQLTLSWALSHCLSFILIISIRNSVQKSTEVCWKQNVGAQFIFLRSSGVLE